ncbi:MAG: 30S ribosomal protein S6 [Thermodesulfovibrionales bacterium]|nr:30S ribosomal protein S6 [Thermodesulfovibrionales bacterium]
MNVYENIVIFDASLSDEAIESAAEKIKDLITGSGGEILKVDAWGRRKLSYEINKQSKGFYALFLFRAPSPVIKKLEELYKVFDPVIKFIVIKLEKKQEKAAIASLAPKEESPAPQAEQKAG